MDNILFTLIGFLAVIFTGIFLYVYIEAKRERRLRRDIARRKTELYARALAARKPFYSGSRPEPQNEVNRGLGYSESFLPPPDFNTSGFGSDSGSDYFGSDSGSDSGSSFDSSGGGDFGGGGSGGDW